MTELRPILTDLGLVEAPRWHDDRLVFSDWGARTVLALDAGGGTDVLAAVDGMMPFCGWRDATQNNNFKANCMIRGSRAVRITPNVLPLYAVLGLPARKRFRTL